MRLLEEHKTNALNNILSVLATDKPGPGGANHLYLIRSGDLRVNTELAFQNGPILEAGVNGITHETLLAILIDRLRAFQKGPYACEENDQALTHLWDALSAMKNRTRAREARGVEGTHTV